MLANLRARLYNAFLTALGARSEAYVQEAVKAAVARAAHEAGQSGFQQGQAQGYQIGRAQGELAGRDALALELQIKHGMYEGGEQPMTRDDIETLRVKQVH